MNYFDDMIEELGIPVSQNWTTQEQILPLSIETFEINPSLFNTPKTLQDLAVQYRDKKNILNKKEQELENPEENSKFKSFLNSFFGRHTYIHRYTYNSHYNTSDNICNVWRV